MKKTDAQVFAEEQLKSELDIELKAIWAASNREHETYIANLQMLWSELMEQEEGAFQRCCELDRDVPDKNPVKSKAVRHWWSIANAALWMFTRTRAQHNHELQPFPSFLFGRLANISEEISNGIIPTFVEDARSGGRPMYRGERHHIAYGVLYIEAVRRGEIDDKAPNQTVRRAYNVTAKAVQGWVKRRDELCVGVPFSHLSADQLREKMLKCAANYARIGRGAPSEN